MEPLSVIAVATFGNQTVNVRIPFEIPAKSMKNHDIAGSEISGFIHFITLKNIRERTLATEWKRQWSRVLSWRKKSRRFSSIVKTQCLCGTLISLKDMEVERSIEYLLPQVGQKRLWQRKGTNLSFPQCGQPYIAPPKEGSPQLIIFSIFSISEDLGWRVYLISS